jgi:predicted DNA-binding protein YlxM (UPF0122 family)
MENAIEKVAKTGELINIEKLIEQAITKAISDTIPQVVKVVMNYNNIQLPKDIKSRHDRRLRNTKLLLKHYNQFKDHIDHAIYAGKAIDFLDEIDNLDKFIRINSIKESISRTHIIMSHIKGMLDLYQTYCEKNGDLEKRKIRTLKYYYFENMKTADIAEIEHVDERTCRRDLRLAEERMSALIFGIDIVREMSK